MTGEAIKVIATYGAYGIAAGLILVLFWLIRWAMTHMKEITTQAAKERETHQIMLKEQSDHQHEILNQMSESIRANNEQIKKDMETNQEAHRHEREEHEKLMDYSDRILNRLEDMRIAFARMNGHGHKVDTGG